LRLIAEPSRTGASPINTIAPTFSAYFGFHAASTRMYRPHGVRIATYSRCLTTPYDE